MPGPPPPPPPPPPPAPSIPPPSIGGGGGPAFLSDIRKGTQLKKVPDSVKKDASAPAIGKVSSGTGPKPAAGASYRPPTGGGGGDISQGDIKAKLAAMFGGGGMPAGPPSVAPPPAVSPPAVSPPAVPPPAVPPPHPASYGAPRNNPPAVPTSYARRNVPAPRPPDRPPAKYGSPSEVVPVLSPSTPYQPMRPAPSVPQHSLVARGPYTTTYRPSTNQARPDLPDRAPQVSNVSQWESQFNFPNENTFPRPPQAYTGRKTYIEYRCNGKGS